MWAAMKQQGVKKGSMTPEKAADLFAYFVSARYFEKPGDAARGKQAFAARHCADCHGITKSPEAAAPPVAKWDSLADPVILAQQMWNHGPKMRAEFAKRKLAWGKITGQELTDMLVYLQNLPETRNVSARISSFRHRIPARSYSLPRAARSATWANAPSMCCSRIRR